MDERSGAEVPLPLMTIRYEGLLNGPKRRVLALIRDHAGECTQTDLARELGTSRGTVSHHVTALKRLGLVEAVPHEDGRKERLRLIPTADLLLEDTGPPAPRPGPRARRRRAGG